MRAGVLAELAELAGIVPEILLLKMSKAVSCERLPSSRGIVLKSIIVDDGEERQLQQIAELARNRP